MNRTPRGGGPTGGVATADVVIIGAGIVGASIAWALSREGRRDVTVVERSGPASGATGRSGALIRMHYTNAPEAMLAIRSFDVFRDWAEAVGGECGLRQTGFIRLAARHNAAKLRRNVKCLQQLGARTQLISAADVREIFPGCATDDFDIAAYEPDSGYADPWLTTHSLLGAARDKGAEVWNGVDALGLHVTSGRVTGVQTSRGLISAQSVVVAAGAWGNQLLKPLGLELGMVPYLEQVALIQRPPSMDRHHPSMIDGINDIYIRDEKGSMTLAGNGRFEEADPDAFGEKATDEYLAHVAELLCRRVPAYAGAAALGGWAGVDAMSADGHPILGQYGPDGLYVALGMSGTGFKIAPAVGLGFAELFEIGHSDLLQAFSPRRFAEGRPLRGENDYHDRADTARDRRRAESEASVAVAR